MGLNFGNVVAVNNILALKDFSVFLFNYRLHDKPTWITRRIIQAAELWIDLRARKEFIELRADLGDVNLKLKDCKTSLFTVLFLAKQKDVTYGNGKELFQAIATMELELEKLKNPKSEASYSTTEV